MERTGASLTTGRTRLPVDVLTWADLATASVPKFNFRTRASGKCPLGAVGSTIQTRSPVLRSLLDDLHHFERWFRFGTYFLSQLFQIASEYAWAWTYRFRWSISAWKWVGNVELAVPSRKWFRVGASRSAGLVLAGVIGRAFRHCSTRQNVVIKISSVRRRFPKTAWKTCLKLRTTRS